VTLVKSRNSVRAVLRLLCTFCVCYAVSMQRIATHTTCAEKYATKSTNAADVTTTTQRTETVVAYTSRLRSIALFTTVSFLLIVYKHQKCIKN